MKNLVFNGILASTEKYTVKINRQGMKKYHRTFSLDSKALIKMSSVNLHVSCNKFEEERGNKILLAQFSPGKRDRKKQHIA